MCISEIKVEGGLLIPKKGEWCHLCGTELLTQCIYHENGRFIMRDWNLRKMCFDFQSLVNSLETEDLVSLFTSDLIKIEDS